MTPVEAARLAHDKAAWAAGQLGLMLAQRRLSRRTVAACVAALEEALMAAKRLLPPE